MDRRALVVGSALFALGCDPGGDARPTLGKVEQASLDDGVADGVFGQLDFVSGNPPETPSQQTLTHPGGVATDAIHRKLPSSGVGPLTFVADRGAHRVIGIFAASKFASYLFGQNSWNAGLPNRGLAVDSAGLNAPGAIAFLTSPSSATSGWMAVADTGNHRVLYGFVGGGFSPSMLFGQHGVWTRANRNDGGSITEQTLADPDGVAFDDAVQSPATGAPRHLWVADTGNHRVLLFDLPTGPSALVCLGQKDCKSGEPNAGGTPSDRSFREPRGIATWNPADPSDTLRGIYVADSGNHRVLHFRVTITGDVSPTADMVFGQGGDFTSATPSKGGITASSLRGPTAVAVAPDGSVWIADTGHHRLLHFPRGKTVADRVLGQPDFTSGSLPTAPSATRLRAPTGVAVTSQGNVVGSDTLHSRVLRWVPPCSTATCDDGNPCTDDRCEPGVGCISTAPFAQWPQACAPYQCDVTNRKCHTTCQNTPGWCKPPHRCIGGRCVIPCLRPTDCASGFCSDGYCCDRACTGVCEACNVLGFEGTCIPAPAGRPRGARRCPTESPDECGPRCNGVDRDVCVPALSDTPCGVEACVDGVELARGNCDGRGTCITKARSCAPWGCTANGCRTSCTSGVDCAAGASCVGGVCVEGRRTAGGAGCSIGERGGAHAALVALVAAVASLVRRRSRSSVPRRRSP